MNFRVLKSMSWTVALAIAALTPAALAAQATATSSNKAVTTSPSRWDIFLGYSYIAPFGTVQTPIPSGTLPTNYTPVNAGAIGSVSYYFNNHFGLQVEGDAHPQTIQNCVAYASGPLMGQCDYALTPVANSFYGASLGPIYRWQYGRFTPFVHVLGGIEEVTGPLQQPQTWGWVVTGGGGVDWETGWLNNHFAIRLFQADYQYIDINYGANYGGAVDINALRASAGIVVHIGSLAPPPPVTLACSANPSWVYPGDPITVTATAGNLDPKLNVIYSMTGPGLTANSATATVATAALTPGAYTVNCSVKEGRAGKEGLKPWESATATAPFTVKAFEPPAISCSANPSTIKPGDAATITAVGVSPQNRPLTYSYSASAGTITGTGTTAEYSSAGAPTGTVGITCNVSDDKGHTESSSTSLTITAPYVPPAPKTQALCSTSFANDKKRPTRVDNEAKACLDQVALDLKQQADAKAVVVGESNADENAKTAKQQKYAAKHKHATVDQFAAQRAVNAKDYLVTEQGIDASRISVATGTTDGQTEENYLVPAGATFSSDVSGTTPVDETAVKPQARKPLAERHSTKKAAQ